MKQSQRVLRMSLLQVLRPAACWVSGFARRGWLRLHHPDLSGGIGLFLFGYPSGLHPLHLHPNLALPLRRSLQLGRCSPALHRHLLQSPRHLHPISSSASRLSCLWVSLVPHHPRTLVQNCSRRQSVPFVLFAKPFPVPLSPSTDVLLLVLACSVSTCRASGLVLYPHSSYRPPRPALACIFVVSLAF